MERKPALSADDRAAHRGLPDEVGRGQATGVAGQRSDDGGCGTRAGARVLKRLAAAITGMWCEQPG